MIRDTGKPVPLFLLEANGALQAGHRAQAEALLTEENLDSAWQVANQDASRTDLMHMVAKLMMVFRRLDAAERWYLRILEIEPGPAVWSQLAGLYEQSTDRIHLALHYAQLTVQAEPDNPVALRRLGRLLCGLGRHGQGIEVLKDVLRRYPHDPACWESLLWHLHYVPLVSREFFLDGYRQWGQLIAQGICPRPSHCNDPDPDRRLRVGFLSPDFRENVAAHAFESFLDGRDASSMEVYGYANVEAPDEVTARLAGKFDGFRNIWGMSSSAVADQVEQDGIDVLVPIGGAVRHHRLEVLVYRPAPVQVDFGSIDTTGIVQIGYRITDTLMDPPEALAYYVEQSVYLPGGANCFRPPQESPLPGPLPAQVNGHITFGAFNVNAKICSETLEAWSRVLQGTPGSRLIMKFPAGRDPELRAFYLEELVRRGISSDRVEIHGTLSHFDHLALIGRADLALDTFPYNGCSTTVDALWMGVPTVSLSSDGFMFRNGLSLLSRVGLEIFVASSEEEYVAKATAFALQREALGQIRRGLRQRLLTSPICDPVRYAREMEQAFRRMWRRWCEEKKSE